ncbi:unnamed protein product [Rotaria sp. Silwood2]|nr:unnamed protein product [Rotaria sp. Silwood2]CAF2955220.1 unnamed protein product [Rotaria sp. Silwood2]CAF3956169.1 unnamed protein product [Rotaria sp. Silwood2]CAF4300998.1 unnamed protein product [Rotaria sp. Silwood2]
MRNNPELAAVLGIVVWLILISCSLYCRLYRSISQLEHTRARIFRQNENTCVAVVQRQPLDICHITDIPLINMPLVQESAPPSYNQAIAMKQQENETL